MSEQIVRVRQVMKTEFDTVDGMTTVYDALKSMRHIETKCLSDIARKVIGPNRSPQRVNVYEVMAKPVITVDPEMNIRYCARLFDRFELSRAPVLEQGRVVGIVSFTDMVLCGLLPE
jgi:CBS domain-containing protein